MQVIIIGAGMSGLCMGIKLKRARIPFVILEKASRLGGTWWENSYPGCACDIGSYLYSFSFAPKPDWSRVYPGHAEIHAYLEAVARRHDLHRHIRFETPVASAHYEDEAGRWRVETRTGEVFRAEVLVGAVGALHVPRYPELPGRERFAGPAFHSATWDHAQDLRNKDVAVIGNGASAVQLVPRLAERVRRLYVFQRTAHWILPRRDRAYPGWLHRLFRALPAFQAVYRALLYFRQELGFFLLFSRGSWFGRLLRRLMTRWIRRSIRDPRDREALIPTYQPGCKRILLSDDYYPALDRDNVELVTEPLREVRPEGLVAGERELKVDALVYATGFRPLAWGHIEIYGRGGRSLSELWGQDPRAYLGIVTPGFPNYYILLGPNTGLGHNSVVWMVECQVTYVMDCLRHMRRGGLRALEVKPEVLERYYREVEAGLAQRVWSDCQSWYQNDAGKVFALWPWSTMAYWWRTRRARLTEFRCE